MEILKSFSDRRNIEFPLLADPESRIIRAYGVLNTEAEGMEKGMAFPGFFFIDPNGVIREKFLEARYQDRFSPNNVISKLFPELVEQVPEKVEAPHVEVTLQQSDRAAFPGTRVSLIVQVKLPRDVHVYSPGVQGYKPIQLSIDASPEIQLAPAVYPRSKTLYLAAIKERVPVFEGAFRITQDFNVIATRDLIASLGQNGETISISGQLSYQACDSKICYSPNSVPVKWQVQVMPLDRQRAPEAIRRK